MFVFPLVVSELLFVRRCGFTLMFMVFYFFSLIFRLDLVFLALTYQ